jgi:zinc protease
MTITNRFLFIATSALLLLNTTFVCAASYTTGLLDNGLKYHIFSTDTEDKYLDIHLLINVGGIDERANEYGSAHMLEHTLFHKSKHFPEGISTELEKIGWKLGEQLNAYTGYQQTKFVMTPPSGTDELDTALLALQDIVFSPGLTDEDWGREQQIVLAERRNNLSMRRRMAESRRQVLYRNSRQANSTLIGSEQDINERNVEVLREFHHRWYQPNNIQIAVVGDVDPEKIQLKLAEYFGKNKGELVPKRSKNYYDPQLETGWYISDVRDKQSKNNQVSLIFRSADGLNRDYDSLEGIRNQQIDRSARTMIMERLDALNLSLPKGVEPLFIQRTGIGHNTAAISLFAGTVAGQQPLGLEQLFEFRQQLLNYPITEKELKFYRDDMDAYIKANIEQDSLPEDIESLTRMALSALRDRPVMPVGEKVKLYQTIMADITAVDVNKRIQDWMLAEDRTAMFQVEVGVEYQLPTLQELQDMTLTYSKKEIAPPNDIEELSGGNFDFELIPGKIISKKVDPHYSKVRQWELSNGDTFVWLNNDVIKDDLFYRSTAKVGYLATDFEGWKARLASQFVWMSAPKGYDIQSLGTWRRRNSILFRNLLSPESFQIKAETGKENAEKVLQAYAAYHLAPKIDDQFMLRQLAGIRSSLTNQDVDSKQVREAEEALRYKTSHLTLPKLESLDSIKKPELLAIWETITRVPVTHYLVADLPEKQVESLVIKYLSGIPRSQNKHHFLKEELAEGKKTSKISTKNTQRTDIDSWFWQPYPWSVAITQQLSLVRGLARNALKEALRGKEKGVYSVDFNTHIDSREDRLESYLHFNSKPENAQKLWDISFQVLTDLPESITQSSLDAEKKHRLKAEERALKRPIFWLERLELSHLYYGDARVLKEMQHIDAHINLGEVKKLSAEIWSPKNLRSLWIIPNQ